MSALAHSEGWQAHLELGFQRMGERTVLSHRRHRGPLAVQRPFYPEGSPCHLYVLHPPGGVVGGDSLTVTAHVANDAHGLITTPGAAKFYRSHGPVARQQQRLTVASGGALEWLPQETIVFDDSDTELLTRIDLDSGARFAGWETLCLGRPAGEAPFQQGRCRQRLELWRDGQPLLIERGLVSGDNNVRHAPWGLHGFAVTATFVITPTTEEHLQGARQVLAELADHDRVAVTRVNDVLIGRYLGASAQEARTCFTRIWAALRPAVLGRPACPPRIWNT